MNAGLDGAASLLVRRQASFDRQHVPARTGSFSTAVVVRCKPCRMNVAVSSARGLTLWTLAQNRFFTDNSLGRQKRLLETTRRRQAKAREKALEQVSVESIFALARW